MAYTFEEIFTTTAAMNPKADEYIEVATTVVVTQEDGRTAYGMNWLNILYAVQRLERGINTADPADDFSFVFSDRKKFSGAGDPIGIQISSASNAPLKVTFTLKAWGNAQYSLDVALPSNYVTVGKIYQGWGDTIGRGKGKALHAITFHEIHRRPIVLV